MQTNFRRVTFFALTITAFMLCLIYVYWHIEQKELADKRQQVFADAANQITSNIQLRLSRYELMLRGVKGFYESSDFVGQSDYRGYIKALQLAQTLPGLQVVAVAVSVPKEQKQQHIDDMHNRGVADYHIKPDGEREEYAPITLIEPHSGSNLNAMGFDIKSNPTIKPALLLSRDTGVMALTDKLNLIQDAGKHVPAAVMYVPIYNTSKLTDTLNGRREAIIGWVSGPFRVHDLMMGLTKQLDSDISVEIYESDTLSAKARLYRSDNMSGASMKGAELETLRSLDIGGKRWTVVMRALPAFEARFSEQKQLQFAAGGIVLSLLLGWLVWLLGSGRERAIALAREMTQELRDAQVDLESTLNAMPDVLFELGLDGRYYNYRTSRQSLLAAPPEVLLGKLIADVLPPKATAICLDALQEANQTGFSSGKQIEVPLGLELRWFELSVARKEGNPLDNPRFIMISRDITDRKLAQNQLRIAAIAFDSQEGMIVTDANNIILRVNNAFTAMTGYTAEEVVGQAPNMFSSGRQDKHFYAMLWDSINHTGAWAGEIWNKRKNGEIYPAHLMITAVKDAEDIVTNYVATITDITMSKAASDEIKMLAFYDPLTHLPNRRLLIDRLNHALASSARSTQKGALLFLDLDHFKTLNDTLGHDVGDLLLQQVARRLVSCVREGDTVARIGGDEFVLILEDLNEQGIAAAAYTETIANKILQTLKQPYQLGSHECLSTTSIGATLFDDHLVGVDELLKQADIAMYEAKNSGRNMLRFFDPKMQEAIASRVDLEHELHKAIDKKQFQLHYQIQVNSAGDSLGAEALIRWMHPERGIISPFNFIPLAEETGLILPIGQWVLDEACAQLKRWEQNELTRHLTLSVNVSAKQFHQASFVSQVQSTVIRHAINPTLLNLELTESMLLDDINGMIASMNILREIGIKFELDDFGTGYSSLQYLKKLPLYQLKIDQSFVRDIAIDSSDRTLVCTIITMAHSLGLEVIAEGVEMEDQRQFLKNNGCNRYQGYLFSKPVAIDEFEALLRIN